MPSFEKLMQGFNPNPEKAGNTLLYLNALGMVLAALGNIFTTSVDKNTSAQDKKFLIPAGLFTGVANIGIYYTLTKKIIDGLKNCAQDAVKRMSTQEIEKNALNMVTKKIKSAEKGFLSTGLFKKSNEYVSSMKQVLVENGKPTTEAINLYKDNLKAGAGVLGAFIGAVVGCSILTPIIRDVSAYFVQKRMENKNPLLQDKPYRPYFDPSHIKLGQYKNAPKQPLNMKNYMAFTSGTMKV